MARKSKNRGAFTLIELLVVIAIVAVLAALAMPGLSRAKWQARNSRCLGNLRQISVACAAYVSTHEVYPLFEELRFWKPSWDVALEPPLKNEARPFNESEGIYTLWPTGIYDCPFINGGIGAAPGPDGQPQKWIFPVRNDYGYNARGVGGGQFGGLGGSLVQDGQGHSVRDAAGELKFLACKEMSVLAPANLIAFGDSFLRSKNATFDGMLSIDSSIRPETKFTWTMRDEVTMPWKNQPSFLAHHARANRIYADGHVSREDLRAAFAASDAQLQQWNIDDLPHGEFLRE